MRRFCRRRTGQQHRQTSARKDGKTIGFHAALSPGLWREPVPRRPNMIQPSQKAGEKSSYG
jgi:hypothetical protein